MSREGTVEISPINTREYEDKTYKDHYTFEQVFVDEIPEDFHQKSVDFQKGKDYIRWQYNGKCPILIGRDEVLAKDTAPKKEAQNQAYFALSILSDEGYVSRFQQR